MSYTVEAKRTREPLSTDDAAAGFHVCDRWLSDVAGVKKIWICVSNAPAAAVWEQLTNLGIGGGGSTPTGTGFRHITTGNEDAAAKLIEDADVAAALKDPAGGVVGLRTLGTGAAQACAGNDGRLSDARTPLAHDHNALYYTEAEMDFFLAGKAAASHPHDAADLTSGVLAAARLPGATTTVQGAVELATDGESAASLVVQANDARLSNARAPTTHGDGAHDATVASLSAGLVPNGELAGSGTPDGTTFLRGDRIWAAPGGGGGGAEPWEGKLHVAWGSGDPSADVVPWSLQNSAVSVAAPTPTGITVSIGRLVLFRFKSQLVVNKIRWFGLAAIAAAYTAAIYRADTGARVWILDPLPVVAGWNNSVSALPITLLADVPYWMGLSAKVTGTTAGFRTPVPPIANSLGLVSLPGNLNFYGGARFAQVALIAGAWPATLPALAAAAFASAGATGTLPIFWLDNNAA